MPGFIVGIGAVFVALPTVVGDEGFVLLALLRFGAVLHLRERLFIRLVVFRRITARFKQDKLTTKRLLERYL